MNKNRDSLLEMELLIFDGEKNLDIEVMGKQGYEGSVL